MGRWRCGWRLLSAGGPGLLLLRAALVGPLIRPDSTTKPPPGSARSTQVIFLFVLGRRPSVVIVAAWRLLGLLRLGVCLVCCGLAFAWFVAAWRLLGLLLLGLLQLGVCLVCCSLALRMAASERRGARTAFTSSGARRAPNSARLDDQASPRVREVDPGDLLVCVGQAPFCCDRRSLAFAWFVAAWRLLGLLRLAFAWFVAAWRLLGLLRLGVCLVCCALGVCLVC